MHQGQSSDTRLALHRTTAHTLRVTVRMSEAAHLAQVHCCAVVALQAQGQGRQMQHAVTNTIPDTKAEWLAHGGSQSRATPEDMQLCSTVSLPPRYFFTFFTTFFFAIPSVFHHPHALAGLDLANQTSSNNTSCLIPIVRRPTIATFSGLKYHRRSDARSIPSVQVSDVNNTDGVTGKSHVRGLAMQPEACRHHACWQVHVGTYRHKGMRVHGLP